MVEPKYKRILIKLSGEALAGERGVGIDIKTVQKMALEIKEVHDLGIEIALVIGGGNLWRGEPAAGIPGGGLHHGRFDRLPGGDGSGIRGDPCDD